MSTTLTVRRWTASRRSMMVRASLLRIDSDGSPPSLIASQLVASWSTAFHAASVPFTSLEAMPRAVTAVSFAPFTH
ncbi:MAG: hypothetical protein IPK17_38165 [Chloroflexi bacterium]|uniref:hypothetical protein n=1 Tax=Candidatus Flexifilum breve TaxID=3140694 RepID=UPI0031355FEE|nr:hypothetical protein [Chloroflexota bacterium]